jgi:hypothetical protein
MNKDERLKRDFNEVENMIAVCVRNSSWPRGEYPELKIGETYRVSHIGVFRSSTRVKLEGFDNKEYNSMCFDLYENGKSLERDYVNEFRFLAPYLREMIKESSPYTYEVRLKEDAIRAALRSIETEHDIKILMAVQTGSRAWGLESRQSDWDVSFIYIHKPEWYSQEGENRCVIEQVFPGDIDIYGWELSDALHHLEEGNPTMLEWLNTYDKYIIDDSFWKEMQTIREDFLSPVKAISYYNQISSKNNERFLNPKGSLKAFLYYLRGVLICKYIESKGTLPSTYFDGLVRAMVDDPVIRGKINALVKIKRSGKNADDVVIDAELIEYSSALAAYYNELIGSSGPETTKRSSDKLKALFLEMLRTFDPQ